MLSILVALICLTCLPSCQRPSSGATRESIDYPVGNFTLTDRSGREVTAADLRGKVWIASFIFHALFRAVPSSHRRDGRPAKRFRRRKPDVRLVTFTVDPEYDTPKILSQYADRFHADPDRWLFLTGKEADVYRLLRDGFKVGADRNTDPDADAR